MLMGIRLQAHPTGKQKQTLSQWMGCARFVWNAKCEEDQYLATYAKKYLPVGTYAPIDQKYSQYKNDDLSPWLKKCPSQILRNSVSNWMDTYRSFLKGEGGKPKRKKKGDSGSIHLTKELFDFQLCDDGVTRLFIGSKTNNIGYLSLKIHAQFQTPNSIYIKKKNGKYWVSFCYEDSLDDEKLFTDQENLDFLKGCTEDYLNEYTRGIDRGVKRPVQCGEEDYDFTPEQKKKKKRMERYKKRYQRQMARQKKTSNQRKKTKYKLARTHQKVANIRDDFCHKTSRKIVDEKNAKILIFEDLSTKNLTRRPKAKKKETGGWEKNQAKAKAGINKEILDKGWYKLERYTKYKAYRAGKAVFKVPAHHTSQECADCGHIHPDNRKTQAEFVCVRCGHSDNADHNAAEVIKKRAIKLILYSGTELSKRGVLLDTGRGAKVRRGKRNATHAVAAKRQKRQERPQGQLLEAIPL